MTTVRVRVSGACASLVCAAIVLAHAPGRASQDPQRPPFRTTTSLVRVDAYPTRDGRIIPDLGATDFELYEDGVPQKIETFEYVEFPQNNPVEVRRDPNSQREGFQLAADPSYRVFVVYLDNLHIHHTDSHRVRVPLITFLNRVLGPKDLFGVITTRQSPADLMLGQETLFIEEQLTRYWDWGQGARVPDDPEDLMLEACYPRIARELIRRRRLDEVFTDLEGLAVMLAGIREERKNLLLVTNGWDTPGRAPQLRDAGNERPRAPSVGITDAGKLTLGRRGGPGEFDPRYCEEQLQRLADIDFRQRHRDLVEMARQSNVSIYSIRAAGLVAPGDPTGMDRDREMVDSLLTLANNTDAIAVVNTNDLTGGARRIADDLSAVYLLGYYPTNQKADGRVRKITVRLKGDKASIRARREYRAPSAEELASLRTARDASVAAEPVKPSEDAFAELRRLRPGAVLHTRGSVIGSDLVLTTEVTAAEVEAGRWREGGALQVMVSGPSGDVLTTARGRLEAGQRSAVVRIPLGKAEGPFQVSVRMTSETQGEAQDGVSVSRSPSAFGAPLIFRLATPTIARPAGSVVFRRTERMRVQWPLSAPVEGLTAGVLGRDGVPLDLPLTLQTSEQDGVPFAIVDLNLAPLTAGEYVLQIGGTHNGSPASARLAFRVTR